MPSYGIPGNKQARNIVEVCKLANDTLEQEMANRHVISGMVSYLAVLRIFTWLFCSLT